MKKKLFLSLICLSALLLPGCNAADATSASNAPQEISATTGDDDMEQIEMSTQETELLCNIYQDTDRIREGKLFSHQKDALEQLRAGTAYLKEKYPSQSFEIISFEPATKLSGRSSIIFQDDGTESYTAYVEPSDGEYDCSDTYYGNLLQSSYDKKVEEILASGGYSGKAYTSFPTPVGMEIGEGSTVDDLLETMPKLTRNTDLFLVAEDHDAAAETVQALFEQAGLYGVYTLYFVPELDTEIYALEADRTDLEYVMFNCFNI